MLLKMIVAVDKKNGIGKSNSIPWYLPEDLKRFAKLTKGNGNNAIIMGRKTFESIGKVLPKRKNLVLTRQEKNKDNLENLLYFNSFQDMDKHCEEAKYDEVWVIGGSSLYKQYISRIDELYVTEVDGDFDCDTFFVNKYQSYFNQCEVESYNLEEGTYTFLYKKCYYSSSSNSQHSE